MALGGGDGLSRGKHQFHFNINAMSDTRLADGAAIVLSPGTGGDIPEGTVFTYGGIKYYPVNGRVYIPVENYNSGQIVTMDTGNTAGLMVGENRMSVRLFSKGINAGGSEIDSAETVYTVTANPAYSLKVHLSEGGSRVVPPGAGMVFDVEYSIVNGTGADNVIGIQVYRKDAGIYDNPEPDGAWPVSGNGKLTAGTGSHRISVSVPESAVPGTYRLVFELGGQKVPYNIIVRESEHIKEKDGV